MHVVIIGAGWAGLAAAIELQRAGIQVTLIEATRQAGGRARRIESHGAVFDNGQHLMLGAYREMLRLQRIIGISEDSAFRRRPLRLEMHTLENKNLNIEFPSLLSPWHVILGFTRARGLSWTERYRVLALCMNLFRTGFVLDKDITVAAWLNNAKQPQSLIKSLWEPLCLAAMNTPIHEASAVVFINVLRDAFVGQCHNSDMLFARVNLGELFPDPAIQFTREQGGAVHFGERVSSIEIRNGGIHGVSTSRGNYIRANHVIIAVPPSEALRLIEPFPEMEDIRRQLSQLRYEPICTVYLQYPPTTTLKYEMVGLLEGTGQYIFDLGESGHPGRMAVVISGPGDHMKQDNDSLIADVTRQINTHFPSWPPPTRTLAIREKRATFSCHVDINILRPGPLTPIRGCWLAGDYTATGFPATLEGALRSGVRAAKEIIGLKNA